MYGKYECFVMQMLYVCVLCASISRLLMLVEDARCDHIKEAYSRTGLMTALYVSMSVFALTEKRDMGLYEVPMSMYLLGFGMGTMLANFHMCGIMLVLRAVYNMLMKNASPRGPMCFRCLMFSLSGPCELLLLHCFIASWT